MATETSTLNVQVNLKDAIKDFELLDKRVDETKDSVFDLEKQLFELEKEQKQLGPKQVNRYRDYATKIDKVKQRLKEEKQDLKELNVERGKAKKKVDDISKGQKDYEGATNLADRATGGLVSTFKSWKVATVGMIKQLGIMKVALLATGIGAIVVAVGALTAAFSRSEAGQNKFSKLMGVIGAVTNQLLDVLADLGEKLIWVFTSPKEALNNFVKLIKQNIINRFNAAIETIGFLGSAIKKVFSGDFTGAIDDAKKAGSSYIDTLTGVEDTLGKTTKAVKDFANETAKEMEIADKIADKRAKADKIDRKLLVERAEANRKYNELRERAADKENVSIEDRIKMIKKAGEIEADITRKEIEAAQLRYEAKRDENALGKSTKEDLDEEAALKATMIDLEAKRLRRQKALTAEITTTLREAETERKAAATALAAEYVFLPGVGFVSKEAFDKIKANGDAIKKMQDDFKKKMEDENAETELQKIELERERSLAELERLNASEDQKAAIILYYADKIKKQKEKDAEDDENLTKAVNAAKIDTAKRGFALVGMLASKGSKIGKIAAVGQTVMAGIQSVQNAYKTAQASPITAVNPSYPINQALLAGAFSAAQLAKLLATNPESPSVGGKVSVPQQSVAAPQFNIVGQGGASQLAASIAEQESEPVQAYVVSQDVTTAQSLENNIITGATLGG